MPTHYDVLGVRPDASLEELRRAYYDRARQLHPDGLVETRDDGGDTGRLMQDVNEAWRVLRDPASRAAYDESLRAAPPPVRARPAPRVVDPDRAYPRRAARPGDLSVALVRAVPWIAVLVVLGAIFVFTAFARNESSSDDVIGRCIDASAGGTPTRVACDQPNDGRVVLVVERQNRCPSGSDPLAVAGGDWYCLRPPDSG